MANDINDLTSMLLQKSQTDLRVALPAKVLAFNAQTQTATIQLLINQVFQNGEELIIPPLVDVPVQFPRAGGFCITCPVSHGDEGTALFHDRCIDGWYETGKMGKPLDFRMHDISDAQFIPGIASKPNVITDFYMDGASMQTDDGSTFIRLQRGKILMQGDIEHTGNSQQTGNASLQGNYAQTGSFALDGSGGSTGTLTADEFVTKSGVSLGGHVHGGVLSGGAKTEIGEG